MTDEKTHSPPNSFPDSSRVHETASCTLRGHSTENRENFWREEGQCLEWIKHYTKVMNYSFDLPNVYIKWFEDGTLNASTNCLDRHLEKRRDKTAIIWEGNNPEQQRHLTYGDLYQGVCQFANSLKNLRIKKGDCVAIYLSMIPEAIVAMLACARLGAVHSVAFGGFSSEALASRIVDCQAKIVITADEGFRRESIIPFKANTDEALGHEEISSIEKVIVVKRSGNPIPWQEGRDLWYHELMKNSSTDCPAEEMSAEDPLFILYTSGSTGKPKGVLHTTGGYMVYASKTFKDVFDHQENDIYWCTADVGWITGHTYIVYGPLANGATLLIYEGVPDYPNVSRFWQTVERHRVTILYTSPTAIRSLMRYGSDPVTKFDRSSLRILSSVGEPLGPTAWEWYYQVVGEGRCFLVDTWWQTETGGL